MYNINVITGVISRIVDNLFIQQVAKIKVKFLRYQRKTAFEFEIFIDTGNNTYIIPAKPALYWHALNTMKSKSIQEVFDEKVL